MNSRVITLYIVMLVLTSVSCNSPQGNNPNIIIILADDMGYGDVQAFNPRSGIPTPNLNQLAEEGIMFTDAHTPSSVCTPTRYGLLTGRYNWRSSLKKGVLKGYDRPLIKNDRITIADYLKGKGYTTGIVGKWHLGLGFQMDSTINKDTGTKIDLTKKLTVSPNDYGFDYSFILPASLDFTPYVFVRNYQVVDTTFVAVQTTKFPRFWREGIKSKSLKFKQVLDDLLTEAKGFIKRESGTGKPFFLYFALTAPHKPVIPSDKFIGTSGSGPYGDFVSQVDWTAGEIFKLLDQLKIRDNTLLIFTSDNGSPMYSIESATAPDHVSDESLAFYNASHHRANGVYSGIKGDALEGGHRVPFILRWPAKISGGKKIRETICLTDIYETIVDVTGGIKPADNAEDSYSFYPIIKGEKPSVNRPPVIHHSEKGMFAIRDEYWKLILGNGSGGRTKPVGKPFKEPYQLYNLNNDIKESNNLIEQEGKVAKKLNTELLDIKGDD